jgi:hypothetical protein
MGAMKYVPGDMRRKEMLYMGCSFENFSWEIKKRQKQVTISSGSTPERLSVRSATGANGSFPPSCHETVMDSGHGRAVGHRRHP